MTDAAPLTSIPEAPVPPGGGGEWIKGAGGAKLRAALFTPKGAPRGSVVLSTGRTECIEKYFEVIDELLERGFVVLAQEWRGQGLSHRDLPDRLKGHAKGYQTFLDDYHALLAAFESRMPKPWLAVGHSMGGCLTLLALAKGEANRFSGAVLSAPMLGVRMPSMSGFLIGLKMLLGQGGDYARPPAADPYTEAFEGNVLTSDPKRFARGRALIAANRDLALATPTWGWIDFAVKATRYLGEAANLRGVTLPVTIVSAGHDQLVKDDAQRTAASNLPHGKFVSIPGAEHEILMETDAKRAPFWAEFDAMADKVAPRPVAVKPAPAPKAAEPAKAAPAKPATKAPAAKAAPAMAPAKPVAKPAAKAAPIAKPAAKPAVKAASKPATPKAVAAKPVPKAAAVKAAPAAKPQAKPAPAKAAKPAAKAAAPKAAKPAPVKAAPVTKPVVKAAAKPKAAAKVVAKPAAAKPAKAPAAKAKAAVPKKAPPKKA
jgi:alpha-beta hydrolase superfamily lysophospholipase